MVQVYATKWLHVNAKIFIFGIQPIFLPQ